MVGLGENGFLPQGEDLEARPWLEGAMLEVDLGVPGVEGLILCPGRVAF